MLEETVKVARRRGRPRLASEPALSRERLVEALLTIARGGGLKSVNVRRLAETLGVSTRLLYNYARDKDQMIDMLNDAVLGQYPPDLSSPNWETRLRSIAYASRDAYTEFPGVAAEVLQRGGRTVGQPHTLAGMEAILAALGDAGLDARQTQLTFIQFAVLVLGTSMMTERVAAETENDLPFLIHVEESLELGLDLLISGIRSLAETGKPR